MRGAFLQNYFLDFRFSLEFTFERRNENGTCPYPRSLLLVTLVLCLSFFDVLTTPTSIFLNLPTRASRVLLCRTDILGESMKHREVSQHLVRIQEESDACHFHAELTILICERVPETSSLC